MSLPSDVFDFSMENGTLIEFLNQVNKFTDVGSGGVLGILILFIVGIPLFLMMKGMAGVERSFGVTSLVLMVLSIFLRILGLITDFVLYIIIILTVAGIALLLKESSRFDV
jgi:hypothetical protein